MRPASAVLLAATIALSLGGCSRDLELPGAPSSPGRPSFSPPSAFAGQALRITAAHLDGDAAANAVNFAHGSARGERWDGADLVVRVPADAGSGAITVSNRDGTSDASSTDFAYLGLGEPRRLQVASSGPILQHPRALHPFPADVVVDSGLYGGLVWAGSPALLTPAVTKSAAAPDLGLVYYARAAGPGGSQLVAVSATTGVEVATRDLPSPPSLILRLEGTARLATFHVDDLGEEVVAVWSASDLTPVFAPVAYGVGIFFGAADVRDGRAIVAGYDPTITDFTLFVLNLGGASISPAVPFGYAEGYAGPRPPLLGTTRDGSTVPIGVLSYSLWTMAAAALEDGNAVIAQATSTGFDFASTVETFNAAPIEAIAARGSLAFMATKPGADYAFGFDTSGALIWMIDVPGPTVAVGASRPTASGTLDLGYVGSDGENEIVVVNIENGQLVARVNYDVAPRAADYSGAAAFLASGTGLDGDVIFPTTAFAGLVRVPVGTGAPSAISRAADVDVLATAPEEQALWAAVGGASPRVDGYLGYAGGNSTTSFSVPLAAQAPTAPSLRLAARGTVAVVGYESGLSLIDGTSPPASVPVAAPVPGATSTEFLALGFTPTGDVWALVDRGADVQALLWTQSAVAAGGLPFATWTLPGAPLGAAFLEDGLWVFHLDAGNAPVATLLDDALLEVRTVGTSDRLRGIAAISPNGRLLVHREVTGALGYPVRFFRADPAAGFPEIQALIFTDQVEGFTFDATGERLFILTQGPDRIVTID